MPGAKQEAASLGPSAPSRLPIDWEENANETGVSSDPSPSREDEGQGAGAGKGADILGALRGAIRRIEDRAPERLRLGQDGASGAESPEGGEEFCPATPVCSLGLPEFDARLGGGFPEAGLSELRVDAVRDVGAGLGFALALAVLLHASPRRPLVWIAPAATLTDAGYPYRPGLAAFGLDPAALVVVRARRLEDALWAAEEAARSGAPALTLLEVQNNPAAFSLEGSRRLHWRARAAGRPVVVLRQGGFAESTAAPLRLCVSAGPAAPVPRLEAQRLLGAPAFTVSIEKSRLGRVGQFRLEWNAHERRFDQQPAAAVSRSRLSPPVDGPAAPAAVRPLLALRDSGALRDAGALRDEPRRRVS